MGERTRLGARSRFESVTCARSPPSYHVLTLEESTVYTAGLFDGAGLHTMDSNETVDISIMARAQSLARRLPLGAR